MTTDAQALAIALQARPTTPRAALHMALVVGREETHYGDNWTNDGVGSNNWGAVQDPHPTPGSSFPTVDHHADGTPYTGNYRIYPTPEAGFSDLANNVLHPNVLAAATAGDGFGAIQAMHQNGYFELDPLKYAAAAAKNYAAFLAATGEPALLNFSPSPIAPAPAPAPVPAQKKSPMTEALPPLPQSPSPESSSGSSTPPSGSADGASTSPDNLRNLVVFAASCELEDMALLVSLENQAGIAERIEVYWADVLHQAPTAQHPPEWCGAFALWCLHQAGLGLLLRWLFGPPHFGFLWNLEATKSPKPGDIAYLDKPFQHHAIVVEVSGDTVHTIDGNQGPHAPIMTHEAPLSHWTAFFSIEALIAEALK